MERDKITQILQGFIRYQYKANGEVTLPEIQRFDSVTYTYHPDLMAFIAAERENILAVLLAELRQNPGMEAPGLVPLFTTCTQAFFYQNNQFITLSPEHQAELEQLYTRYLEEMVNVLRSAKSAEEIKSQYQAIIEAHLFELQAFVTRLAVANSAQGISVINTTVVCALYPPDLQLSVLGIEKDTLVEPILDVGCGKDGNLVREFRQWGLNAFGIDRQVNTSDWLVATDWLDFHFDVIQWGTIISHMAFSNHFIFHHIYQNGTPERYALKYREMLMALKPGGTLYYTPGLPFIEQYLTPARFHITRKAIALPQKPGNTITELNETYLGSNHLYATQVQKLM